MIKQTKIFTAVVLSVLGISTVFFNTAFAASAAKQLEKGIALYNDNKTNEAMDYFIDVMLNGTAEQVAQANRYVNMIHNQIGGIQNPVEVDVNYNEGALRQGVNTVNTAANDAWNNVQAQANQIAAQEQQMRQDLYNQRAALENTYNANLQNAQNTVNQQINQIQNEAQQMVNDVNSIPTWVDNQVNDGYNNAQYQVHYIADELNNGVQNVANTTYQTVQTVRPAGTEEMTVSQLFSNQWETPATQTYYAPAEYGTTVTNAEYYPVQETVVTTPVQTAVPGYSVYNDLSSPEAVEARSVYTQQKIDHMRQSALDRIAATPGVHLYMRDGWPDAIDIDDGVVFQGTNFRPEALPLLNDIYEVLALTQGAEYVILPAGSYTDDVTLSGIREAMAMNSYFVKRGISQGKLYYNMGLVDKEAPAQFANLKGLSIVFDYDSKLPAAMPKNMDNETDPLLSMAIVPQCHAIDTSLGEAYGIDFSVLETENKIDNWVLQVVQHGRDGKYYIVRQLEGFGPIYHLILWNGRKGILGPELPCGKYTVVLTATDTKGNKQTLRRRLVVKCNSSQSDNITAFCGVKEPETSVQAIKVSTVTKGLNYKSARLWTKPRRTMGGTAAANAKATVKAAAKSTAASTASSTASAEESNTYTYTKTVTNIVQEDTSLPATTTTTRTVSSSDSYYEDVPADLSFSTNPYASSSYTEKTTTTSYTGK